MRPGLILTSVLLAAWFQFTGLSSGQDITFTALESAEFSDCSCGECTGGHLHGGFCTRPKLLGDWHGTRPALAQHGIVADLQLTQFYQGVTSGGAEQTFKYGGKMDYMFTFLGEPLGLWKGFTTLMHAETQFGGAIVGEAGALALPNTNMLYPLSSPPAATRLCSSQRRDPGRLAQDRRSQIPGRTDFRA